MNWKLLLILPVIAVLCGEAVDPPALKPEIIASHGCEDFAEAKRLYLIAYAYRTQDRKISLTKAARAQAKLNRCRNRAPDLEERILSLLRDLCPAAGNGLHHCL